MDQCWVNRCEPMLGRLVWVIVGRCGRVGGGGGGSEFGCGSGLWLRLWVVASGGSSCW